MISRRRSRSPTGSSSCRPGPAAARSSANFSVTLPRPRDIAEVRLEPAFHHIHKEIWASLRVEVQKAYAQSEGVKA